MNRTRAAQDAALDAERGRMLIEESREIVLVLDESDCVVAASRRAREALEGLEEGRPLPEELLRDRRGSSPLVVPYEVEGRRERIVYLGLPGGLAAYEELRAGFTASVSHELRTPLARLLALLETALLPGEDPLELVEQARSEVEQITELIDDVLFLSELETGRAAVALRPTRVLPLVEGLVAELEERAARAAVTLAVRVDPQLEVPLRPRMLRVVLQNLIENSIRYAGPGSTCVVSAAPEGGEVVVTVADDGIGVAERDLPRLFERFFRADRARASRGTGLGLAIVKHVVSAAGGTVEAAGSRGAGLEIRCRFAAG